MAASTGVNYSSSEKYRGEKGTTEGAEKPTYEYDVEGTPASDSPSLKSVHDHTHRQLKPRHIQLIGIGGTIGTALYVQIGRGLMNGGPGSLFLAFSIWYVLAFS